MRYSFTILKQGGDIVYLKTDENERMRLKLHEDVGQWLEKKYGLSSEKITKLPKPNLVVVYRKSAA